MMFRSEILRSVPLLCLAVLIIPTGRAQFLQQGGKLVGTGAVGANQGASVAVSQDGNTAIVGGPYDNDAFGALWIFTRNNGIWSQQGGKLVGSGGVKDNSDLLEQGNSVAISADGNTAIWGAPYDNNDLGAAWVFTRSNGVWSQQGSKLVGTGGGTSSRQGTSVALSADGNTAIVGGSGDGSVWTFARNNGVWSQRGQKLTEQSDCFGSAAALSADGNTALVGAYCDGSVGAAWVFTQVNGGWSQGTKLVGSGAVGDAFEGLSVALSSDGNTAMVGGYYDNNLAGAAWVFTRSNGVWIQQGNKLGVSDALGTSQIYFGYSVALSGDGNTAIVGAPVDNNYTGAARVFTRSNGVWQQQSKLVGAAGGQAGSSVALSTDGSTAIVGGPGFPAGVWAFYQPVATHFSVLAPPSVASGVPFTLLVSALDANTNLVSGYLGTVHFTSSDGAAALPANATLINGTGTLSATLNTVGNQTITATDTVTASITGVSGAIAVGGTSTVATMSSPTPFTTLTSSSVTFFWNAATNAAQYWLNVGNGPLTGEYTTGALTTTSKTVSGLPCDGRTLYVSLYTMFNGAADYTRPPQQYTYTACTSGGSTVATISFPTPSTILPGTSVTFFWNAVSNAAQYWLDVGNGPLTGEYTTGALTTAAKIVSGLPCDGRTLYVSLYTMFNGAADYTRPPQQYTYTACSTGSTVATMSSPAPGTTLTSTSVIFFWNAGTNAALYWLNVGNGPLTGEYTTGALTATSKAVSGLPCDGRTLYVSLYTMFNGAADYVRPPQQYTYTACSGGPPVATMSSPTPNTTLTGTSVTFFWNAATNAAQYWLNVGNGPLTGEFTTGAVTTTSKTVSGLPCDGRRLYVSLYTMFNGAADYTRPPQQYTYTACSAGSAVATMSFPTPGTTLTGSSVTFSWNAGTNAVEYWLDVGNAPLTGNYTTGAVTATSKTVSGLPCDGRTLYVSLYTMFNGAADYTRPPQQYTYTAFSSAFCGTAP